MRCISPWILKERDTVNDWFINFPTSEFKNSPYGGFTQITGCIWEGKRKKNTQMQLNLTHSLSSIQLLDIVWQVWEGFTKLASCAGGLMQFSGAVDTNPVILTRSGSEWTSFIRSPSPTRGGGWGVGGGRAGATALCHPEVGHLSWTSSLKGVTRQRSICQRPLFIVLSGCLVDRVFVAAADDAVRLRSDWWRCLAVVKLLSSGLHIIMILKLTEKCRNPFEKCRCEKGMLNTKNSILRHSSSMLFFNT